MIRRPPRSTQSRSSAASDVYKRQLLLPASRRRGTEQLSSIPSNSGLSRMRPTMRKYAESWPSLLAPPPDSPKAISSCSDRRTSILLRHSTYQPTIPESTSGDKAPEGLESLLHSPRLQTFQNVRGPGRPRSEPTVPSGLIDALVAGGGRPARHSHISYRMITKEVEWSSGTRLSSSYN